MKPFESLFRPENINFFLVLESERTVKSAAKSAGISVQHAARLLRIWRDCGWVRKEHSLHGDRYRYSGVGVAVCEALEGPRLLGMFAKVR